MEVKKYPKADLTRLEGLIFSISLLVTMIFVITAFEWKQYDQGVADLTGKTISDFETTLEVPPTEILPPPPPQVNTQPRIVEVPDDQIDEEIQINLDVEITETSRVEEIVIREVTIKEEEVEEIFVVVEQPATPKDGLDGFYGYVGKELHYPAQARRMNIEGRVFIEFVINKDGTLTDVKVIKGIGAGCDEEAVRVLENAPPWNPAKQRGKTVRQRMVIPIIFKIAGL
ncbi:MAG: energy transducer TonB [Flammeovirgaceae bacterium]|nr:energy transducer TonB [Flammeovirgaceae bacterium]